MCLNAAWCKSNGSIRNDVTIETINEFAGDTVVNLLSNNRKNCIFNSTRVKQYRKPTARWNDLKRRK